MTSTAESAPTAAVDERAVENVLGQQVMGDFRPSDLFATAGTVALGALRQPGALARASLGLAGELRRIATGDAHLEPPPGDRRFSDPAWGTNRVLAGVLQAYLAWRESLAEYAHSMSVDDLRQAERIEFLFNQVGDALAPTNFLLANPVALRTLRETKGASLLRGARNLLADVRHRQPIPSQVDQSAFRVGENLAITPGSVVVRTEMFELIQYAPQTLQVHERPIVIVPSIVNKYYVFDLAPDRSIIEHYVRSGFTVFTVVWRNPQRRHDRWGMPEYQDAVEGAIDAARAISGAEAVNVWAVCGAGPVVVSLAGYLAATGQHKINSLLLVVSPLDMQAMSDAPNIGAFVDKNNPAAPEPIAKVMRTKRLSARDFTLLFAMLRANDLIWNYWVNNYLLGKAPAAFDVLYWNADGTGMTASFNHDFSEFVEENPFVTDGAMTVRGVRIAPLSKLGFDSYVLGAKTDHLCIWQGVYRSAQLLAPNATFVLGNSGHIQTIVCPPGNKKASFSTGEDLSLPAEQWLATSTKHAGSWWDHGVAWTAERSGDLVDAPTEPGSAVFAPLAAAPGKYVHERA